MKFDFAGMPDRIKTKTVEMARIYCELEKADSLMKAHISLTETLKASGAEPREILTEQVKVLRSMRDAGELFIQLGSKLRQMCDLAEPEMEEDLRKAGGDPNSI